VEHHSAQHPPAPAHGHARQTEQQLHWALGAGL
jgi:hypothetical protein